MTSSRRRRDRGGRAGASRRATITVASPTTADVSTSIPANTTFIDITCTTLGPVESQACANAFATPTSRTARNSRSLGRCRRARAWRTRSSAAEARIAELQTELEATTDPRRTGRVERRDRDRGARDRHGTAAAARDPDGVAEPGAARPARSLAEVPSNKDYVTTGVLAAIVGLALGIGLAFVRERLDERIGRSRGHGGRDRRPGAGGRASRAVDGATATTRGSSRSTPPTPSRPRRIAPPARR